MLPSAKTTHFDYENVAPHATNYTLTLYITFDAPRSPRWEQVTIHIVKEVTKELASTESTPYWTELALNFAVDLEQKVSGCETKYFILFFN